MNYLWTTLHVNDLDKSAAFYSDVTGLQVLQRFSAGPGIEIVFIGNGKDSETLVELYSDSHETGIEQGVSIALGFEVASVAETIEDFRSRKITIEKEPFETPKFIWFSVKDPDGLTIQFFEKK